MNDDFDDTNLGDPYTDDPYEPVDEELDLDDEDDFEDLVVPDDDEPIPDDIKIEDDKAESDK